MSTAVAHHVSVEILTTLDHGPAELRGTTGYFRPEKARWTISRGSQWARTEDERSRQWDRTFEHVEVFGPKTRAPQGGVSGVGFLDGLSGSPVPDWLASQRPAALDEAARFLTGVDR